MPSSSLIGLQVRLTDLFPPGKGGGQGVEYGFKGKGILIHLIVDAKGMPLSFSVTAANGDERIEAKTNTEKIRISHGKPGRPRRHPKKLAGDKGFDSKELRDHLRKKGIKPEIPKRKWKNKAHRGRPLIKTVERYVVERAFAWVQRKFRRVAIRWERLPECFEGFVALAMAMLWVQKIVG